MVRPAGVVQGNAKHFTLMQLLGLARGHFFLLDIARSQAVIIQFLAISCLLFSCFPELILQSNQTPFHRGFVLNFLIFHFLLTFHKLLNLNIVYSRCERNKASYNELSFLQGANLSSSLSTRINSPLLAFRNRHGRGTQSFQGGTNAECQQ